MTDHEIDEVLIRLFGPTAAGRQWLQEVGRPGARAILAADRASLREEIADRVLPLALVTLEQTGEIYSPTKLSDRVAASTALAYQVADTLLSGK
jgi:hypothetical protein